MPANQSTPEVTFDIRRNPESIWLSPICDDTADHGDGRTWASPAPEEVCEDPECGEPWVRYVREDLASPARGGDELRATAQFLSDRLDDLEWMDGDLESTLRDFMGHVDPAHARLKSALASTDMAGAGEIDRPALMAAARLWWSQRMPNSTCVNVAIKGDGRVDVHWRDADESGRYTLPVDFAAPPVEGLTSGGKRSDADLLRLIAKDHARLAPNAYHSAETLEQIADRLDAPKAAATASVRETLARAIDPEAFEPTDNYDQRISRDMRRAEAYSAADRVRALTDSGTADTHAGSVRECALEEAARIADAFARGQAQIIAEEGPDEACRGGKEVGEFIAKAIRRRAALHPVDSRAQGGEK